mmetsp:Transcript_71004/g.159007  ORF Transcript_71004/g.159007 Transcript_71004/m.159007 type:complete len:182 (-) Transcript_71004:239-784(-)
MPSRAAGSGLRTPRPVLLPVVAVASGAVLLLTGAARAFVSAPREASSPAVAVTAAIAAGLATPLAVNAELPPLEDLPLDEVNPTRTLAGDTESFFGISFPMVFVGLIFAVSWAAFWVTNLTPKKDEEGVYKTYVGAGELPPEGYTNPLDPRVSEEYADEEDPLYLESTKKKGERSAGSAIV